MIKTCIDCGLDKKHKAHGLCVSCYSTMNTARWRANNPEKDKVLRAKEKPRTAQQSHEAYLRKIARDPDYYRRKCYERYWKDPEKGRSRVLKWAKDNPEKNAELSRRRYARLKGSEIGPINLDSIWERQCGWCPLCLTKLDREVSQLDHIKPITKGGSHTQENLQFVHAKCNMMKGNKYEEPVDHRFEKGTRPQFPSFFLGLQPQGCKK